MATTNAPASHRRQGPIRVGLADDHPAIRASLMAAVEAAPDLRLVGTAGTVSEALDLVERRGPTRPDVLVCDLQLAGEAEGMRVLDAAVGAGSQGPAVIFLTGFDLPSFVRAAFERGAAGYLSKTVELDEVLDAIRTVAAGGTVFTALAIASVRAAPRLPSDREREVLALIGGGASNDETAARLGLSEKTVESHLRRLFDRYGVLSRTELVVLALREGWISDPPAR
jgi:DNA-binding NarL/FixJ family response regulator